MGEEGEHTLFREEKRSVGLTAERFACALKLYEVVRFFLKIRHRLTGTACAVMMRDVCYLGFFL